MDLNVAARHIYGVGVTRSHLPFFSLLFLLLRVEVYLVLSCFLMAGQKINKRNETREKASGSLATDPPPYRW